MAIKLQKSTFLEEEKTKGELCDFILKSDKLSMSDECAKFELNFSDKQKRKYSVFVNSGSSANLILIQALLNLKILNKGDTVAVSSVTWATNIMPLIQLGLHVHFVDCEVNTLNVSRATLENALNDNKNIKALFLTNALGLADDINNIQKFCSDNEILLLEDNCESLGTRVQNKLLGNYGLASTFSFFVGHHISCIEGGMVATDNFELYCQLVMIRAHGWDRSLPKEEQNRLRAKFGIDDFYSTYTFYNLGFNVRPTEINGFLGNNQIKHWDFIVKKRHENFIYLNTIIESNIKLIPIKHNHISEISSFAIPVIAKEREDFDALKELFVSNDVEIRPMIAGNISSQPFLKEFCNNIPPLKNSNFVHNNSFYFGNNPEITKDELLFLGELLANF